MIISKNNGEIKIIYKSKNINELYYKLEEFAFNYLKNLEVKNENIYKPSKSKKYGNHPYGFFIVSKYNKLTIFNKFINTGIIYSSTEIKKIISFYIIKKKSKKFNFSMPRDFIHMGECINYKRECWDYVHNDIINAYEEKNKDALN